MIANRTENSWFTEIPYSVGVILVPCGAANQRGSTSLWEELGCVTGCPERPGRSLAQLPKHGGLRGRCAHSASGQRGNRGESRVGVGSRLSLRLWEVLLQKALNKMSTSGCYMEKERKKAAV